MRILIIEDDLLLGDGLHSGLRSLGFAPDWVHEASQAWPALCSEDYAAAVLDVGLPGEDGISLLHRLRQQQRTLPVLILTARDGKSDKLAGFKAGADDYVIKPVDMEELAARLHALIRRTQGQMCNCLVAGEIELDPQAHRVRLSGMPVNLTGREFALLEKLMSNLGRVLSKSQLEAALYGWGEGAESNTVEVHIHHLRRKLGSSRIVTLRGIGYMMEP
jgi:DNA-binding response OmpR family regulator